MKVACTVWTGGKGGDNFKALPIGIKVVVEGNSVSVEKSPFENKDHTYTFTVDARLGIDVVVGSKFGVISLA